MGEKEAGTGKEFQPLLLGQLGAEQREGGRRVRLEFVPTLLQLSPVCESSTVLPSLRSKLVARILPGEAAQKAEGSVLETERNPLLQL